MAGGVIRGRAARDPVALEAGRTAMSWTRTALALVVNGSVVVRAGLQRAHGEVVALGALLVVAAAAAFVLAEWRRRRLIAAGARPPAVPRPLMAGTLAAAWVACAAGIVVVLWRH
jgi:uncharacterized membrane protein YidH (DUF202 family)